MKVSSIAIMFAYGYPAAGGLLRGRRTSQFLTGGGAARRHSTGREPPDPVAREAARRPAPRPVGPAGRADRRGTAALPQRGAPPRPGGAAARRARRGGRGRADRPARARRVDRAGGNGDPDRPL